MKRRKIIGYINFYPFDGGSYNECEGTWNDGFVCMFFKNRTAAKKRTTCCRIEDGHDGCYDLDRLGDPCPVVHEWNEMTPSPKRCSGR